jgi:hypothetical protein
MDYKVKRELFIIVVCLVLGYFIAQYMLTNTRGKVYNCDLAEISPDFPLKVKEECRKLRTTNETGTSK